MAMTHDRNLYYPTEEENEIIRFLSNEIRKIGDFQIHSIELLSDEFATFLFSIKTATPLPASGKEMLQLHTVAQDVSDKFDRNLIVSTTGFTEGGRQVSLKPPSSTGNERVVPLNPNKTERTRSAAAAPPPRSVFKSNFSSIILMENVCIASSHLFSRGFVEESSKLTTKLAQVVLELLRQGKLSKSDLDVETICFDIAKLLVDSKRTTEAEVFLKQASLDASLIKRQQETRSMHANQNFSLDENLLLEEVKFLIESLEQLL